MVGNLFPMYMGKEDKDVLDAIKRWAKINDRSQSWAARDLIRKGAMTEIKDLSELKDKVENG